MRLPLLGALLVSLLICGLIVIVAFMVQVWRIFHQQAVHHAIDRELQSLKRESR